LKALVDSGCTHTRINKQLVKEKKIKTKPIDRLFEIFIIGTTKNREFALLEVEMNKHKEHIDIDLNGIAMFLGYN